MFGVDRLALDFGPKTEEKGGLEDRARDIRRHWFSTSPRSKQDEIIKRAFEEHCPDDASKREARKRYEQDLHI